MNRFGMNAALKTPRVTFIDDDAPALRDGMIAALNRSQAVIEFELDGRILDANENFCRALGYSIDDRRVHTEMIEHDERREGQCRILEGAELVAERLRMRSTALAAFEIKVAHTA